MHDRQADSDRPEQDVAASKGSRSVRFSVEADQVVSCLEDADIVEEKQGEL